MLTGWLNLGEQWYYLCENTAIDGIPQGAMFAGERYDGAYARSYYFVRSGEHTYWNYPLPANYTGLSTSFYDKNRPDHKSLDIPAPTGTAITAVNHGTVIESGYKSSMGNYIIFKTTDISPNGNPLYVRYLHMVQKPTLVKDDSITRGMYIGGVGATGTGVTGPHLHIDVNELGQIYGGSYAKVNPASLFYETLTSNNGSPVYGQPMRTASIDNSEKTNAEFDAIHTPLINYVGEENFVQWLEENKDFSERINIRTFVQRFQINWDDFCTALANETNGVTVDDYYTPEQLDAIFTDDLSQVIEAFDLSFSVEQLEEMENGVSQ